jgi:hypothetical protein
MAAEPYLRALTGAPVLRTSITLAAALFALSTACRTVRPAPDVPALVVNPTPASRSALEAAVREASSGAPATLADDALTRESVLLLERAPARGPDGLPLSGRETRPPERFLLVKRGPSCVLVHEASGKSFALPGVECEPERR